MSRAITSVFVATAFLALAGVVPVANLDAADVIWVHQLRGQDGEGTGTTPNAGEGTLAWEDDQWRALLEDAGHNIVAHEAYDDLDFAPEKLDVLNSVDLVIFSRDTNSGDYNEFDEQEAWTEGVTVPMMILTPFVLRNSRWDMADTAGIIETNKVDGLGNLVPLELDHPIFTGALDENGEADIWDEDILLDDDSIDFLNTFDDDGKVGNGTVLAIESDLEFPWIIYWEAGEEFYDGSLFAAGGPRLYYSVGSDDDPYSWGEKNTTPEGDRILLNAINWLTGTEILVGDYNGNGELDTGDLDLQAEELNKPVAEQNLAKFDLNDDGVLNVGTTTSPGDRLIWVKDLRMTSVGDANFDNVFDSGDLVDAFIESKYGTGEMATWSQGDWNGDLVFDSGDLVLAFQDGGYVAAAAPAVPEPSSLVLALLSGVGLIGITRRRHR